MADLDAELLALAGGDDSSDEETSMQVQSKDASPPPASSKNPQPLEADDDEMARKGVAKLVKRRKKAKIDDEIEEGELYVISSLFLMRQSLSLFSLPSMCFSIF